MKPSVLRAHEIILTGPNTKGKAWLKQYLSGELHGRSLKNLDIDDTEAIPFAHASQEPRSEEKPTEYRPNPDYDENYVPPEDDIPF